jgi:hypothetical protein
MKVVDRQGVTGRSDAWNRGHTNETFGESNSLDCAKV